jgi:DNA-directed RNA polymerase specialized sigma24 family protein
MSTAEEEILVLTDMLAHRDINERRDTIIRRARAFDWSARDIALKMGLSRPTVDKVLKESES